VFFQAEDIFFIAISLENVVLFSNVFVSSRLKVKINLY